MSEVPERLGCVLPARSESLLRSGRPAAAGTTWLHRADVAPRRAAGFLLGFAALLALPLQAEAQTTYVSNIGQDDSAATLASSAFDLGQGFTTGTDTAGYTLGSVDIRLRSQNPNDVSGLAIPTVSIVQGTPTGTVVAMLIPPASLTANTTADYTFTAPANTTLIASTTYYVVIEAGHATISMPRTNSNSEDSGGESDWSIADKLHWRTFNSNGNFSTVASILLITVKGTGITTKRYTVRVPRTSHQPGAPTGLTATASGSTRIDLSWTAPATTAATPSPATGSRFRPMAEPTGSTAAPPPAAPAPPTPTPAFTAVPPATTASRPSTRGTGAASNVDDATTEDAVPGAPTSLSATASGTTTIDLTWTHPINDGGVSITGYKIEVSPNGTSNWTDLVANNTSTTYSHTGLSAGTTRHYRVSAINSVGTGTASSTANATTVPGAPTGLTATASGTSTIDLGWTEPADNGDASITGYKIEVSSNGASSSWSDRVANTGTTTTTYSHTGLSAATTRHYRVSAINSAGTGAASSTANATTEDAAAPTVPGAPTGLTATASGSNRIDLDWTEPAVNGGSVITGYRIEVSSNGGTNWADLVANTNTNTTTYSHTGLSAGTTRHYRVSAINSVGTGAASTTATTVPGAPTGLTATASGSNRIDLDWTEPADDGDASITGYKIEVSSNGGTSWADLVANTTTNTTTYSHTGLSAATTRHYRVSAINSAGTGAASSTANATTEDAAAPTVPGAPTGLSATASGSSTIDLSWTAPADNGGTAITGYRIEVSSSGTSSWSDLVANTNTTTTYSHTGVSAGTTHYRVSAINSVGTGTASGTARATATTVPGAPTGLMATASGTTTIDLDWTQPSHDGHAAITGYRIEVSPNGTSSSWSDLVANTTNTTTTYSHTGLSAATTRHYRVSAINANGTGAASSTANATTEDAAAPTVPGAPTGLTATASGTSTIDLDWTEPADNGDASITGYRIEVSSDGTSDWTERVGNTGTTTASYSHTGLSAGATRHYRVSAINSVGTGTASNTANATTDAAATVPGAPTSLSATASGTSTIDLDWTAPVDDGGAAITGYRIEVSPDGTSDWTERVGNTNSTGTTYSHTGLSAGTTRHYRVSAINSVGTGTASSTANATTEPLQAEAQTTYVSNIGQSDDANGLLISMLDQAQGFTTGTDAAGYTLGSVDIRLVSAYHVDVSGSDIPTVSLFEGAPPTGLLVEHLTPPASITANTTADYTFTAPANLTLTASTIYYVVLDGGRADISTARTNSDNEDSGGESNWSIADVSNRRPANTTVSFTADAATLMIKIKGPGGTTTTSDATLSALTVNDGTSDLTLSPAFASGTFVYTASVTNAVDEVTLTATPTHTGASVSAVTLGGTAIIDTDFTDGITVPSLVEAPPNTIVVTVTAEDGSTTQPYTVTVTRAGAGIPTLSLAAAPTSIAEEDDATTTVTVENVSTVTVWITNGKTFAEDQTVTLTFSGDATQGTDYSVFPGDADTNLTGHQVVLVKETASVEVTVTATGNDTDDGNRTVTVAADLDGTAIGSTDITILDDDTTTPNTPPTVATAIPDQSATVGTAFSYAFPATTFTDAESDPLTYTATKADGTPLPTWLSFNESTRAFSGTPPAAGTVSVKVTASDGAGSGSDTFDITVSRSPPPCPAPRPASRQRPTGAPRSTSPGPRRPATAAPPSAATRSRSRPMTLRAGPTSSPTTPAPPTPTPAFPPAPPATIASRPSTRSAPAPPPTSTTPPPPPPPPPPATRR